ncbi:hypothetical protein [Sorangium sp. So ce1182]|uniref:hypothetical protein n=1 Tax=Sorangium sp. So ce1182 TaxID=3133334 RepID=UPI003F632BD5
MIRAKMNTIAVVILAVVIVASVFGILWSRQRTRMYQEQRDHRAEELKRLRERTDELERRIQEEQRQRPPSDGAAD